MSETHHVPTYGPHWKEYSMQEAIEFFKTISPDFSVAKAVYVPDLALEIGLED